MLFGLGAILFTIGITLLIIRVVTIVFKIGYCFLAGFINQVVIKAFLRKSEKYKEYEEERRLQNKIEETEKARLDDELLNKKHDNIAYALSLKMEDFSERYPLADKELLKKYKNSFTKVRMDDLEAIEKEIEISHYNAKKQNERELGMKPKKIYDEVSLPKIPTIHSRKCHIDDTDVELSVHQDEDTYIVYINAPAKGISRIVPTFDKIVAVRIQNAIATRCGLAALKPIKIEEVLNNVVLDEIIAGAVQGK